jgi:transposase
VQIPPPHLGYGFSVWSVARLGQHLKHQTGIAFSEDQLGRLLHQEGFSFQRPKHTLKGKRDESAYEQARQELQDLKKKPWPRRLTPC